MSRLSSCGCCCCPVSVLSNSFWPHGLQNARLACPSLSLGACLNSCPLRQWCHLTILSSVIPFSSCLQSFPESGSFSNKSALCIRWPKYWSFSFSISPCSDSQDWFPFGLTGLVSLQSKRFSRVFSNTTVWKCQFFSDKPLLWFNSHIHTWLLEKQ